MLTSREWRNSPTTYGVVAKTLHWGMALLFLIAYCAIYYRHWLVEERSDAWLTAGHVHRAVGISIGVFMVLRIAWRWVNTVPTEPSGSLWEKRLARAAHYSLYFFMIAMPISGYFGTDAPTSFGVFMIPNFAETSVFQAIASGGPSFEQWERPLDFFHRELGGALFLWMLILVHAGAALYHHFVRGDDVLTRMLPSRRSSTSNRMSRLASRL